jgi:hypothetical protein
MTSNVFKGYEKTDKSSIRLPKAYVYLILPNKRLSYLFHNADESGLLSCQDAMMLLEMIIKNDDCG